MNDPINTLHSHTLYIQCNVLFSARRHKLQLFAGFSRRVVVVFPSADEWRRRLSWHQSRDGEQIPDTALLKLQGPDRHTDLDSDGRYGLGFEDVDMIFHRFSSSELQPAGAAERAAGGAAVRGAAAGAGPDTSEGAQRGGSQAAAPPPRT